MEAEHTGLLRRSAVPPEQGDQGSALGAPGAADDLRAALLRRFAMRVLVRSLQERRHQPQQGEGWQEVSSWGHCWRHRLGDQLKLICELARSAHVVSPKFKQIVSSTHLVFCSNFQAVAELVLERARSIPRHLIVQYWGHALLEAYRYLGFRRL